MAFNPSLRQIIDALQKRTDHVSRYIAATWLRELKGGKGRALGPTEMRRLGEVIAELRSRHGPK
jgi:hypothetical protein